MPMPFSIYDTTGVPLTTLKPTIDSSYSVKQLLGASPVHTAAAIYRKLEPSIRQSPLEIAFYKMSAADMIRQHYHTTTPQLIIEDQHSLSSVSYDSTNSSVSDAIPLHSTPTLLKSKKRSHQRLLREIRRLRSENANLHNSVNILKEDLRHERESRQIAEQCHKKYFDDSISTHTQLELEIMDQQDQLKVLKTRLDNTTNTSITSYKDPVSIFDDEIDDCLWNCEDMDCSNERRCYGQDDEQDSDDDTKQDDDDDDDQFENLAVSYLQQALVANLTSARANLEFDDLTLKYDPSPDRILRTLADAFLVWLRDTIHTNPGTNDKATAIARLISTRVQQVFLQFWKSILERYVHNDEDQYQFLHQFERILGHHDDASRQVSHHIVQNFHRLLVMFYKYDIVGGDAVTTWWHTLPDHVDAVDLKLAKVADELRTVTKKFVEWVDDDDDDQEEDDDDQEDEESIFGDNDGDDFGQDDSDLEMDEHNLDGFDTSDLLAPEPSSTIHPDKKKKSVRILV